MPSTTIPPKRTQVTNTCIYLSTVSWRHTCRQFTKPTIYPATALKGVLKSRLLQLTTDALNIVQEKIFKLDRDFDLLVDDTGVES